MVHQMRRTVPLVPVASARTRDFAQTLKRFEIDRSLLVVDTAEDNNLMLSSRNVKNVQFRLAREVSPYELLQFDRVWISQPAVTRLQEALKL